MSRLSPLKILSAADGCADDTIQEAQAEARIRCGVSEGPLCADKRQSPRIVHMGWNVGWPPHPKPLGHSHPNVSHQMRCVQLLVRSLRGKWVVTWLRDGSRVEVMLAHAFAACTGAWSDYRTKALSSLRFYLCSFTSPSEIRVYGGDVRNAMMPFWQSQPIVMLWLSDCEAASVSMAAPSLLGASLHCLGQHPGGLTTHFEPSVAGRTSPNSSTVWSVRGSRATEAINRTCVCRPASCLTWCCCGRAFVSATIPPRSPPPGREGLET